MMSTGDFRIALLHDELTRRGGAEAVFEELIRLFPQADVYALYAGRPRITVDGTTHPVHTSFLQNFPAWFRRHPSRVLLLLPHAAEQLDFSQYDVVLSSSSGFSKSIVTRATVPHICYCHTPTRYLWDSALEATRRASSLTRWPLRLATHYLRLADYSGAQRVDTFLANSRYTQERISSYYRRESSIVYPPIDTTFYHPAPVWHRFNTTQTKNAPFLAVGRLTPSKKFDQAIIACEKLQYPLIIAGVGSQERRLRSLAGKWTTFAGRASRERLRHLYRTSRALLQPGVEDFGMAAAEAQACGIPVIAYGMGGVREIVQPHVSGLFYATQRVEALAETLRQFIASGQRFRIEQCQRQSLRFTTSNFHTAIQAVVTHALEEEAEKT